MKQKSVLIWRDPLYECFSIQNWNKNYQCLTKTDIDRQTRTVVTKLAKIMRFKLVNSNMNTNKFNFNNSKFKLNGYNWIETVEIFSTHSLTSYYFKGGGEVSQTSKQSKKLFRITFCFNVFYYNYLLLLFFTVCVGSLF